MRSTIFMLAILDRYCLRHSKNESATDEVNEIRCAEEMCRCIIYDFQDDTEASRQASALWLSKYPDAPPLYIASVNDALAFLLDYLPPQMHPTLPLHAAGL